MSIIHWIGIDDHADKWTIAHLEGTNEKPLGGFEELAVHAETIEIDNLTVKVIALDDLIRIKQHLGRRKDRDSLELLLAIKRVRESQTEA